MILIHANKQNDERCILELLAEKTDLVQSLASDTTTGGMNFFLR